MNDNPFSVHAQASLQSAEEFEIVTVKMFVCSSNQKALLVIVGPLKT